LSLGVFDAERPQIHESAPSIHWETIFYATIFYRPTNLASWQVSEGVRTMATMAVIDFETTGLSPDRGDRATEVKA
jgi:DNA polymerase III epsilon subunit-like protein